MKGFVIPLTGAIFVILLASTIQSVDADHVEEFGQGIFKDEFLVNFTPTKDTKWIMHLQVEIRNAQNQLVTLTETVYGYYIPHEIADYAFDTLMGEKEIITIDNIKYEKAQYVDSPMKEDEVDYVSIWALMVCGEILGHGHKCVSVFQASTAVVPVTQTDVVTNQWTILRNLD